MAIWNCNHNGWSNSRWHWTRSLQTGSQRGRKKFGKQSVSPPAKQVGVGAWTWEQSEWDTGKPVDIVFDAPFRPNWWLACYKSVKEVVKPVKIVGFLPELSQTMAYTTRKTVNGLTGNNYINLNNVLPEWPKGGINLHIELKKQLDQTAARNVRVRVSRETYSFLPCHYTMKEGWRGLFFPETSCTY